jgi:hypothetical protein
LILFILDLIKKIENTDKHIAGIYDGKVGSRWVEVMAYQLAGGVISTDDLNEFDVEAREAIMRVQYGDSVILTSIIILKVQPDVFSQDLTFVLIHENS